MDPLISNVCEYSPKPMPVRENRMTSPQLLSALQKAKSPKEAIPHLLKFICQNGGLSDIDRYEGLYEKLFVKWAGKG